jgi:acetyltransferase-like isoleucine patch superfamily enzyme
MEKKAKRRVRRYWYDDRVGPLGKWRGVQGRPRMIYNVIVLKLAEKIPFRGLKAALLRKTGMKVGRNVIIHPHVHFDSIFPEMIEIGDNTVIGYGTTILSHELLVEEYRKGPVSIGKNCMVGALCLVLAGVRIGNNSVVGAYSLVNRDVGEGKLAAGVPARVIKKMK